MYIFDGTALALEKEEQLAADVATLLARGGIRPTIAAILFREDIGSQLYTRLKREAAARVGINYVVREFSLTDPIETVTAAISQLNSNQEITGIIVQKPWRKVWLRSNEEGDYASWWHSIMFAVDPSKDVDGLHPETLAAIKAGTWEVRGLVLPATCQAVLFALDTARSIVGSSAEAGKTIIIGRSDLLGLPLFAVLHGKGLDVELIGVKELQERSASGQFLRDASRIVSATGQKHLVTGEMVSDGVVVVDVGEPQPDVDQTSIATKASFLTPVPGGIGPLTVSFLLENAMILSSKCN
ncbi:hypothetical protein KA012_04865 [Candidatus Woesebacteria bacterium]|nr:hypothetical protein [Candidatus Woesebacteria bacterium]